MIKQYEKFLARFDEKMKKYFERDKALIKCEKGCSLCCTNGNYPLSQLEMSYLMRAFSFLEKGLHEKIKNNIKILLEEKDLKNHICPFLVDDVCSVYTHRPLICRVHGVAFRRENGVVNLPGCSDYKMNYSEYYDGKTIGFEPVNEDLSLYKILQSEQEIKFGKIRAMLDWFRK